MCYQLVFVDLSKMAVRPMASPIDGLTKSLNQADIKRQAKRFLRWRKKVI